MFRIFSAIKISFFENLDQRKMDPVQLNQINPLIVTKIFIANGSNKLMKVYEVPGIIYLRGRG